MIQIVLSLAFIFAMMFLSTISGKLKKMVSSSKEVKDKKKIEKKEKRTEKELKKVENQVKDMKREEMDIESGKKLFKEVGRSLREG